MLSWVLIFVISLVTSGLLLPVVIYATHKSSLLDHPDPVSRGEQSRVQKIHEVPVPRLGGIAIVCSFFAVLPLMGADTAVYSVFFGGLFLFLVGMVDDLVSLTATTKLCLQVIISFSVVFLTGLGLSSFEFLGFHLEPGYLPGLFLSTLIIVAVVNSINMIDGLDGLAAGVCLIAIAMLSYLHFYLARDLWLLKYFFLASMGSLISFLKFNTFPARIFMGDGGSHWLGYLCAVLAIIVIGRLQPEGQVFVEATHMRSVDALSVMMCLALPISDTLALIYHRAKEKKSPFHADNSHVHHTLQSWGLKQQHTVSFIYFCAFGLAVLGLLPVVYPQYEIALLPPVALGITFLLIVQSKSRADNFSIKSFIYNFGKKRASAKKNKWVTLVMKYWAQLNRYVTYSLIIGTPFLARVPSQNLGQINLGLCLLCCGTYFMKLKKRDSLVSLILAISICSILVSVNQSMLAIRIQGEIHFLQGYYNSLFSFLAVSSILYFVLTFNKSKALVTPTDFLLVLLPLLLLIVPDPWNQQYYLDIISARTLVMFFVLRTFVLGHVRILRDMRFLVILSTIHLACKALLNFQFI